MGQSVMRRARLIGAVAGLVIAILNRIEAISWIVGPQLCPGPLSWLVSGIVGALHVRLARRQDETVTASDGALGGAFAGGVAGAVQTFVSLALILLFDVTVGDEGAVSGHAAAEQLAALYREGGSSLLLGGIVLGIILGTILTAIPGAIGGLLPLAVRGR